MPDLIWSVVHQSIARESVVLHVYLGSLTVKMGNIQKIITLIALINLGCVFSQKVRFESQKMKIVARTGERIELPCLYRINTDLVDSNFAFVPNFFKFQDYDYIEDREGQEIDTGEGVLVIKTNSVQDDFDGDITSQWDDWNEQNSNLGNGERSLILIIQSTKLEDSGVYICEAEQDGEVFQLIHTLTVVPRGDLSNELDVRLSGKVDATKNETFGDNDFMVYYSSGRIQNPKGVIECKACDGAAKPIVKVTIGGEDITDSLVEETVDITLIGDTEGKQEVERCVTLRNSEYWADGKYDQQDIVCRASVNDTDGNELGFKEVTRTVIVYNSGRKIESECAEDQYSLLGDRGQIRCSFTVNPEPEAVYWEDRNNRDVKYGPEDDSGEGWTTTLEGDGNTRTAILTFDKVEASHYTEYYLIIENKAGETRISITFAEGEATGPTTGASGLHCTLCLALASVLVAFKLLTL